jgi:hypothetical protein
MDKGDKVFAPFSVQQVQHLNEWQSKSSGGFAGHPFTCQNRVDGNHGFEGGDLGVLIATTSGWVCPDCEHRQDWAYPIMAEKATAILNLFGEHGRNLIPMHQPITERLTAYQAMAIEGKPGAEVMLACLLRRKEELEKEITS